jgi:hypothetical protein
MSSNKSHIYTFFGKKWLICGLCKNKTTNYYTDYSMKFECKLGKKFSLCNVHTCQVFLDVLQFSVETLGLRLSKHSCGWSNQNLGNIISCVFLDQGS